jgi:hypothetical protein
MHEVSDLADSNFFLSAELESSGLTDEARCVAIKKCATDLYPSPTTCMKEDAGLSDLLDY